MSSNATRSRLFGWSDLHVDYPANFARLEAIPAADHQADVLLVAGDVSSDPAKLLHTLTLLRTRFAEVAFVPGNHDLWVNARDRLTSLDKLHELRAACRAAGIRVDPFGGVIAGREVRIVPLVSWYARPGEAGGSLFLPKPGEDPELRMWADNHRIKWPPLPPDQSPATRLLSLNPDPDDAGDGALVVTFSHFLPRVELIFSDWARYESGGRVSGNDRAPEFNFTRVAGCEQLDGLLRQWRAAIHLYGHQHRNRERVIAGVRYVSHCLGYPAEWNAGDAGPPRHEPLEIRLNGSGAGWSESSGGDGRRRSG